MNSQFVSKHSEVFLAALPPEGLKLGFLDPVALAAMLVDVDNQRRNNINIFRIFPI
jgi:hypothetical protein